MSASNRGVERQRDDNYSTDSATIDAIIPHVPTSGGVLEAGCGKGNIIGRLCVAGVPQKKIVGVEFDAGRAAVCRQRYPSATIITGSFLEYTLEGFGLCVMNPPYALALEFLVHALKLLAPRRGTLAALTRLNFIAPASRADFFRAHTCDVYALERRPEFIASLRCIGQPTAEPMVLPCGWRLTQELDAPRPRACPSCGQKVDCSTTDATEYGWLVFGPGRVGRWQTLPVAARGAT